MIIKERLVFTTERSRPQGGQHVGTDNMILIVTDPETGVVIKYPPDNIRSQHKRKTLMVDAMEYLVEAAR